MLTHRCVSQLKETSSMNVPRTFLVSGKQRSLELQARWVSRVFVAGDCCFSPVWPEIIWNLRLWCGYFYHSDCVFNLFLIGLKKRRKTGFRWLLTFAVSFQVKSVQIFISMAHATSAVLLPGDPGHYPKAWAECGDVQDVELFSAWGRLHAPQLSSETTPSSLFLYLEHRFVFISVFLLKLCDANLNEWSSPFIKYFIKADSY